MLQRPSVPLFLQFKLSHKMVRRSAMEIRSGHFKTTPFFRMHIWSRTKSRQQALLMDLEDAGMDVYYVAPAFFSDVEFNNAFQTHTVNAKSIFVRPSVIGRLTDDEEHWVAFNKSLKPYVCSTPKPSEQKVDFANVTRNIEKKLERRSAILTSDRVGQLLSTLVSIVTKDDSVDGRVFGGIQSTSEQLGQPRNEGIGAALQKVAYIARTFLSCELLVASPRQ